MSLIPGPDADLLEAASLCRELALRMRDAAQRQIETEAVRLVLADLAQGHDTVADELEQTIRARDLLPRVPDPEMAGLHGLGDQVAGLLDAAGVHSLLERFAAEQHRVAELMDSAAEDAGLAKAVRSARQKIEDQGRELDKLINR